MIYFNYLNFINRRFILLILFFFVLFSCADKKEAYLKLKMAEEFLFSKPDSSLSILQSIDDKLINTEVLRANYSLLYSVALDKNGIDLDNDSIISNATKYYIKYGNNLEKANLYYSLAKIKLNCNNNVEAVKMLLLAKDYSLKINDTKLKYLIYMNLAAVYFNQGHYNQALLLYNDCLLMCDNGTSEKANVYSYLAKTNYLLGNDSLALTYFTKANNLFYQIKDSANFLNTSNAIVAINLDSISNVSKVILNLKSNYIRYNNSSVPIRHYPLLARLYLKNNQLDSARHYALKYLNFSVGDIKNQCSTFALLSQIEKISLNYKLALNYNENYVNLLSIINRQDREKSVQNIEKAFNIKNLKERADALLKQKNFIHIISNLIFVILLLSILVIYLLGKRKLQKANKELYERDIMINDLNNTVNFLNREYQEVKLSFDKENVIENNFLLAFKNRINWLNNLMEIAYLNENTPKAFMLKFKEYVQALSIPNDGFSDIRYIANKMNNRFIDYLSTNFPQLTENDLDFCAMICMNFSANSMRLIYGHTNLTSIFNKRKRLREKLGINQSISLEKFLAERKQELFYTSYVN